MPRQPFRLPDIGEGTAQVELVAWHVAVGDSVAEDQPLCDVMTDKATVEVTAPFSGTVIELAGTPGAMLAVGSVIVTFDVAGEIPPAAPPAPAQPAPGILASPALRRRAAAQGIDLRQVAGSGEGGRIRQADLDAWVARAGPPPPQPALADDAQATEVPVIGLRRRIAERMQDTKRRIPHFTYVEEVAVGQLEALREHLNATRGADRPKLTMLPFLVRALARVLPAFPHLNARYDDTAGIVRQYAAVHVGIATQTPQGLVVTVLRDAARHDLWGLAAELVRLSDLARAGRAAASDLTGSTITITSLGAMGGIATTPIINSPEVAIVGVNRVVERPVVADGQIRPARMMNLSCSFDHRVVDGWDAAQFVQRLKALLEMPALLFVEP